MKTALQLVSMLVALAALHQFAVANDKPSKPPSKPPSDLIVGKWKDRAEPSDAVVEFVKDGSGAIRASASEGSKEAKISWKVTGTYKNACIIVVEYEKPNAKDAVPLPKEAQPFTWLIVFDGKDRFVTQPVANKVVFMQRQK